MPYSRCHPLPAATRAAALALGVLMLGAGCQHSRAPTRDAPSTDEQVNVGYGTQEEKNLTGSVSSVSAEELEQIQGASMERLLIGRIAGLQIIRSGGEPSLRIRGMESGAPHVVIDGAAASARDLLAMVPGMVSRIDVLKDASAAVYGFRGANGVILVTTKRRR
jgi:TonB-dependent SusC/RagA subfamily outer membrane receptor